MIRAALLSLALTGSVAWEERQESFASITCPTLQDAQIVANVSLAYNFAETVSRRTHCLSVVFQGHRTGETADFNIGNHIFSFLIVESEGYQLYVLQDKGEGFLA